MKIQPKFRKTEINLVSLPGFGFEYTESTGKQPEQAQTKGWLQNPDH